MTMKAKKKLKSRRAIKLTWPSVETPYPFEIQIKLPDCKHGYLYQLASRNLRLGVFNEATSGFIGIRIKFDHRFLFTEDHYDTGIPHGTACPLKALKRCPKMELIETNKELFSWLIDQYRAYGLSRYIKPSGIFVPSKRFKV